MARLIDLLQTEIPPDNDRDVGGVEFTNEELSILVAGFQGPFYELYSRILKRQKELDIECSIGTPAGTDMESMYRSKGSYLGLLAMEAIPAEAHRVFSLLQQKELS